MGKREDAVGHVYHTMASHPEVEHGETRTMRGIESGTPGQVVSGLAYLLSELSSGASSNHLGSREKAKLFKARRGPGIPLPEWCNWRSAGGGACRAVIL